MILKMNSCGRRTLRINSITSVGVIAILFCVFSNVNSYSKYGRGCRDIGCLPSEVCVMSHDSCDFGQRDGKECGSYPTCQKNGNSVPSGNGGVKPSGSTSHQSSPVHNSNVPMPSGGGGGNANSGGFDGFSAGGHGLYPSLPNNPSPQYPSGGYQPPYNPYGGYNPGMGGGNNGGYNGGAGGYNGGSGGYYGGGGQQGGGGGYNNRGGYQPAPPQPQPGKKDEGNGFFKNLLNQAASQYLNGQIQRVLNGGGQQPQPSGGYGNGGGGSGSSGGSSFLNSFLGSVLNGGGGGGNSQPPRSSQGGSGGLSFLGDLLNSRGGGGGGGGSSAISEILGSRNFGGLFNEKTPSGSSNPAQPSYGGKSYPTQGPTSY